MKNYAEYGRINSKYANCIVCGQSGANWQHKRACHAKDRLATLRLVIISDASLTALTTTMYRKLAAGAPAQQATRRGHV